MLLSIAGSMPIGMFGLAILLLARDATGSLADAGRIVGAFTLANALGSVAQGRLIDRLGQGPVLRTVAIWPPAGADRPPHRRAPARGELAARHRRRVRRRDDPPAAGRHALAVEHARRERR